MVDWNYTPERPISLTIAADARLGPTSYTNDQIWELVLGSSEPPALNLQTTFGLRARSCRIFPRFIHNGQVVSDPAHFYRPIIIRKYYPNYISLSFKPFSTINADLEFWVPTSQAVAGRMRITNAGHSASLVQLEWALLLVPSPDGRRMAVDEIELSTILAGQTSDLFPVFFLTGSVQAGNSPYPSLNSPIEIPPHAKHESRWVNASLGEMNSSFKLAKELMNQNWDPEIARIQRVNSRQMEIITGNQDWNTALILAQTVAQQLILQPEGKDNSTSVVYTRHPDQGYSLRKDGSDYNYLWSGQTASDVYYMSNFLLPSSPEILRRLVDNLLASQTSDSEIDWKPGLGGQRTQLLATPLLATLIWKYYQYTQDHAYIRKVFNQLTRFYFAWFLATHDQDNDIFPEWEQVRQTGFEEHPLFSFSHSWSTGLDISTVESPDLAAYLFKDGQALLSIARLLGEHKVQDQLKNVLEQLQKRTDEAWSEKLVCYLYRDRDSHLSGSGSILGSQAGSGIMEIHQEFDQPVRPLIFVKSKTERTQPLQVYIHGITPAGAHRVDNITSHRMRWHMGTGYLTSDYVYQHIEQIDIRGLLPDIEVIAASADLTRLDQTLLLPLWAGIPSGDRATILINLTILDKNKFLSSHGLRISSRDANAAQLPVELDSVGFQWNSLVLEGMLHYGMFQKASDIFTRLMKAVQNSLYFELKFHQSYQGEDGKPTGLANSLTSLLPVGLFLKILGVEIINSTTIEIVHGNPFPWPVTIKYCGLTVVHQEKKTTLIFPDGQTTTVENEHPQTVCLSQA
jgi:hypothetical protein